MKNDHRILNPIRAEKERIAKETRERKKAIRARLKNDARTIDEILLEMLRSDEKEGVQC